jgi:hypothetical protein
VTARTTLATEPRRPEHSGAEARSPDWNPGPGADKSDTLPDGTSDMERLYQMFYELNRGERARVLQALAVSALEQSPPPCGRSPRARMVCFLALCCVGLIPWTIGLAVTLPRSYLVDTWPLAWVGFDTILLGCLGTTAWAFWKKRQVAVMASLVTSVLLLCDAWFDVMTAHSGRCLELSITTAMLGEIPIGVLLGLVSVRLLHASRAGDPTSGSLPISLWQTPLRWPARQASESRLLPSRRRQSRGRPAKIQSTGVFSGQRRDGRHDRHQSTTIQVSAIDRYQRKDDG